MAPQKRSSIAIAGTRSPAFGHAPAVQLALERPAVREGGHKTIRCRRGHPLPRADLYIGLREVLADEQQGLPPRHRERVAEAVTEVQARRMTPPPEP